MPLNPPRKASAGGVSTSFLPYPTEGVGGELVYTTSDGDVVDEFGSAHYGFTAGVSEAIYARNPWLSRYDLILPAGLSIILPVITTPTRSTLWTY